MSYFEPIDPKQHELGKDDADIPDYCANCGQEFMAHTNGVCPK